IYLLGSLMEFSDILAHARIDKIEDRLPVQLENVDLIGQLELDETSFDRLMKLMYDKYFLSDLKRGSIPSALFLTSMIFCARYSSEQSRKFWEPYAHIWKQKPDANFQRWCREHFIKSSRELAQQFGFDFPKKNPGDVVRPVYYHALIPAHLKDNFASWLNQMLPDFMRMDIEQIANDLEDRAYSMQDGTLKRFLQNEDAQPAAVTLIAEMMDCVRLYQGGEKPEDIWNYLSSIIERDIWEQLLPNIQSKNLPRKRILQPKIEWIWDLDSGQMLLRVRDIVSPPEFRPYQLVVSQQYQSIHDSDWRERIYAWGKLDGTWYIDEYIIEDITEDMVGYQISIVDINDQLISGTRLIIPSLPEDDVVFWRITQQGIYALPLPPATSYPDGDWIVLLKENTSIETELEPFYKPDLLELEYARALRGSIKFPVSVHHGDGTQEQLESKYFTIIESELQGEQLKNISRKVPPIFTSTQIQLKLKTPPEQVKRLKLQIEQDGRIIKQFRLSQIDIQAGHFIIELAPYLQDSFGKFSLNLVRSISSVLSSPIQFSILSQVEIVEYPKKETIYHADHLPRVLLKGIDHLVKIEHDENTVITKEQLDNVVQITWTDLQKITLFNCH
ncbi:MAG: hypothetical protein Q9P01_14170, partial [Anaerolineae bacterium]|nr:hypothetical protein [Anaerolineae bacterium]